MINNAIMHALFYAAHFISFYSVILCLSVVTQYIFIIISKFIYFVDAIFPRSASHPLPFHRPRDKMVYEGYPLPNSLYTPL